MADVSVVYGDFGAVSSRLGGCQELTGILDRLRGRVDQLVSSGFVTDRASGAFRSSCGWFTMGAAGTVGGLDGMSRFPAKTREALSDLDSRL